MNTKPIKKVNIAYLLTYIFVPIVVTALCIFLGWMFYRDGGTGATVLFAGPFVFDAAWYILVGAVFYNQKKKKLAGELDQRGFTRNYTFTSSGCTVVVDVVHGQLAMLFSWNPFEIQVVSASRIGRAWTDDGAFGVGITRGTSRVSFLFTVDQVKVRVNTFTSNQRWKMDDGKVLTGISKADMYVEALNAAKLKSQEG